VVIGERHRLNYLMIRLIENAQKRGDQLKREVIEVNKNGIITKDNRSEIYVRVEFESNVSLLDNEEKETFALRIEVIDSGLEMTHEQ
jgi:hypothetical protein